MSDDIFPRQLRLAVGDVVLGASKLEVELAQTARRVQQQPWSWARQVLGNQGRARSEAKDLLDREPPVPDHHQLEELYEEAVALIQARHRIVHDPFWWCSRKPDS